MSEGVLTGLADASARYPGIEIRPTHNIVRAQDLEAARSAARQDGGHLFVWGWYTQTDQKVVAVLRVEVLQSFLPDHVLTSNNRTFTAAPSSLDGFQIQGQLSALH